jgi:hypothetical protein
MSETKMETPALSLLDQFKMQHALFMQQKELAQNNLNQLVGAIYACEIMIQKFEQTDAQKGLSQENLGDQGNGEANKMISDAG